MYIFISWFLSESLKNRIDEVKNGSEDLEMVKSDNQQKVRELEAEIDILKNQNQTNMTLKQKTIDDLKAKLVEA